MSIQTCDILMAVGAALVALAAVLALALAMTARRHRSAPVRPEQQPTSGTAGGGHGH